MEHSVKTLLPVTVLSGFSGAGKTTVLRHILDNRLGDTYWRSLSAPFQSREVM